MKKSGTTSDVLDKVHGTIPLDVEAVRAQTDAVLDDELYWFPVRHHSPAVAWFLSKVIEQRRPRVVFVEGPHEANDLIEHVIDRRTKPPVAIYSSYRDDDNVLGLAGVCSPSEDIPPRFSCWYPLVAYSPEYVAMESAGRVGADVIFMDLPHYAQVPALEQMHDPAPDAAQTPVDDADAVTAAPTGPGESKRPGPHFERETDRLIFESGFYQQLAETAGYRCWPEAWDTLFELETDHRDPEDFRRELATFCAAARATTLPRQIEADGTRQRERFMIRTIRETLRQRKIPPAHAMVVCGGFHLFLDRDDREPPPALPPGTVYTTVVPYSFFRISELSGYGAGNRAPQFYQLCWELGREGRGGDATVEHVVAVLKQARKEGEPLSSADAIAASQHAHMLAGLRGRRAPVLDDIHDALVTCCCKGDPQEEGVHLLRAMDAADIGTQLGRVTPALGRLPLVSDFYLQLDQLEIRDVMSREKRLALDLDKRQVLDARRSAFLHRLAYLEVPLGKQVDVTTGAVTAGRLFRERWDLRWSPKVEAELVEQNLYGDSVEAAALARLQEDVARDQMHAGKTCERLVWSVRMDLPGMIQHIEDACGKAIDCDPRFISLCSALTHLAVIDRYADYRGLRRDLIADLTVRCFDRACFALPDVASAPEDQQQAVVSALKSLADLLLRNQDDRLDRALFVQHVRATAEESKVPFLRGALLGMLAELRDIPPEELAAEISLLAKATADRMVTAGDLIDGIMAVSHSSILLGADALVGAIDELLRAADGESFLVMIPRMRAAFERLHDRHRESFADCVARRYGLAESEPLAGQLSTSVEAAVWIARIDAEVARMMQEWDF